MIPNWVDTQRSSPQPRDNEWAREHGLVDRFVVMHSGNVGHAQDLDTLVRATTFLRDLDDLAVVIVGCGARRAELDGRSPSGSRPTRCASSPTSRARPFRRRSPPAHLHFVGLGARALRLRRAEPAVRDPRGGRPVLVAADADSETARS